MTHYLFAENNLADLNDIVAARTNLGLGNVSTMNNDNVNILGGNISIDNFRIFPTDNVYLKNTNYFLKSADSTGLVEWFEIPALDWLENDPKRIMLSSFCNNGNFIRSNDLSKVAFTGNWHDIENKPQSLKNVFFNDFTHELLYANCNLSDLTDVKQARFNLGLGDICLQSSNDVNVSNLIVSDKIKLLNHEAGYLYLDLYSNITTRSNFDLATNTKPGIVFSCNVNVDNSNTVPTSSVLYELNSNILDNLESVKANDYDLIMSLLENKDFLMKSNFLNEFSSDEDKSNVRSNIGLGDLATQNSSNVTIDTLNVSNIQFNIPVNFRNKILYFDDLGNSRFDSIPLATSTNAGAVKVVDDYDSNIGENSNASIISFQGFSNYKEYIDSNLNNLRQAYPKSITELRGSDVYLRKENNLLDLSDIEVAKTNLGLATVATTGRYEDLLNESVNISAFSNDVGFLKADNNLSDVADPYKARKNLGLGTMATQDSSNVRISGGIVKLKKLELSENFFYQSSNDINDNGKILVCDDRFGKVKWKELPKATNTTFGSVKITDFIMQDDVRTDVVPTCRVFREIEDNITRKLTQAMTKLLSSDAYIDKLIERRSI